jgi:hypothetical protein
MLAAFAEPLNVHPSVLTLANLVLGVTGSGVVLLADRAQPISVVGLIGPTSRKDQRILRRRPPGLSTVRLRGRAYPGDGHP